MNVSKEDYEKIGFNLGQLRNKLNKSQKNFADDIKMNRENYTSIENGKGVRHLKDYQIIELARLYNVSTDYILGLTPETSTDVEIKDIYDKYGLTEKSLKNLETINSLRKIAKAKNNSKVKQDLGLTIETINVLLAELEGTTRKIALLDYINTYINLCADENCIINIQRDGKIQVLNKIDNDNNDIYITMSADSQIDILLLKIQQRLEEMRKEKQENSNNNSKK